MIHCTNCADRDHVCAGSVPIFSSLGREDLLKLQRLIQQRSYRKGELLFSQGDVGQHLYIVRSGRVKLYTLSGEGRQQIIRILNPGDFFGELAIFQHSGQSCWAEAMEDSGVCLLPQDGFRSLLQKQPDIALSLLDAVSERLVQTENFISDLTLKSVEERLISWLLVMVEKGARSELGVEIQLDLTRQELADLLGTTMETVSRRLNALQADGLLQLKGHRLIIVPDTDRLGQLVGRPALN